MKHVAIDDAKSRLEALVAEIESSGDDVVLTRNGVAVARLVREGPQSRHLELTPEQIEKRRQAIASIRERAAAIDLKATPEEIKSWINEGRRV
ncbi:antitoxin Phd_YefM of type II toxin-antitoxin system [Rhodopseudomonas thermotolerans]|jgi:antitoxin (DNA-binding transcriptional repressor) of toxin-antitoxin stability system|uniref:Antitoxin n=3 Tax=Rhodopseudomonas TaxID=1073 RepID=A0A336JKP0_9BRAD|nr:MULTISPECIES: type II toxin-antitoxin system Phd/YefM family antitoxin [Rhodopseudomonas]NEW87508.1 type II toxin-antitoxin system Phd/YefM family antitoxin [Rhodopseudomonas sp. WA056]PZA13246.1 type II toxin-antitoxin system Phd/YefM family antitoxin [Rhodopseudomonas palustris]RED37770.1 antitoxin Phd_YefM of type II toxin-antitoxin system [Rhodopseudomonas pentothenatexigens]REG04504.1 antitoxin Phd_YefM of type II toxin-antitoxin system [Rhodopseudomonas thermotolerans]SSW90270.1 antit